MFIKTESGLYLNTDKIEVVDVTATESGHYSVTATIGEKEYLLGYFPTRQMADLEIRQVFIAKKDEYLCYRFDTEMPL